ncbi:LAME_0E06436g1_1 [Lachancea meyersii CBS 8951]|uniref:LAME_0E06436g1_1 n=1 Tax=Lachancea meyersii CBS 8951 TaxID=1266667 RepID=A0A1G4JHZ4_9SACH|nr:LAME_0E06436g1_1 [Lachancea meyersii CBS 8951]
MDYNDSIISHFRGQDPVSTEKLTELVNEQKGKVSQRSKKIAGFQGSGVEEQSLRRCESALSIFKELIKLQFLIQKSWDLQALSKSVLVRFDIQTGALPGQDSKLDHAETFYRELALKTITRCGKLSEAIEALSLDSQRVRDYLDVQSSHDPSACLEDSTCLLLEIWFLCGKNMRSLKRNVAELFIRAKLLLIDCELEVIKSLATEDGYGTLQETVVSYRSFIRVLLQQMQDADVNNDQGLFEECLQVFLDVESMFNVMNFNYLLYETQYSQADVRLPSSTQSNIVQEASELRDMSQFANESNASTSSNDENEFADLLPQIRNASQERRMSETSNLSVSLMMEKTSLKRELPKLLQAFNDAKRLEQELENARAAKNNISENVSSSPSVNATTSSLSSSLLSPSSSLFMGSASRMSHDPNSSIFSVNSSIHSEDESRFNEGSLPKAKNVPTGFPSADSFANSITYDSAMKLSSSQQLSSSFRYPRNVQGFSSNVLNNLYGLGNKH